jgi:putative membrane protein
MILTLIAAPLVALGLPPGRWRWPGQEAVAALGFAAALWVWHSPAFYDATFRGTAVYWTMHLSTWGAAVLFWRAVLRAPARAKGAAMVATIATGFQMALLGAIITWASRPLYAPHYLTTAAWGLTPLGDQQFGGALMWAPGGLIFLAAIIAPLAALLRRPAPGGTLREA